VVAIVKSGQQLFNEAALKSQNEDAADTDAPWPDIAMAALFNLICKKFVMSGLHRTIY
jgi:hypothetical protein